MVRETNEKIKIVQEMMRTAQNKQKSYADKRRKDLEFQVGDHVHLKVWLVLSVVRFGLKKGKLSPWYIGPFEILECIEKVAYRLALPPKISGVHNVFYISMLKKCFYNPKHEINFKDIEVNDHATYYEGPVRILDQGIKNYETKKSR